MARRLSATHQAQTPANPTSIETVRIGRTGVHATRSKANEAQIRGASAAEVIAVIDCGSSSVRAFLAEVEGDQQRILEDLVYPVDLTAGFTGGKLDREAMDSVVTAIEGIRAAASAYRITNIRAVATSALREANNSDVLIERVRARCGIDLEAGTTPCRR